MGRDLGGLDAVGVFFASQLALQNELSENPVSFWRILSWQLFSGYVWFALSPLILWLNQEHLVRARQKEDLDPDSRCREPCDRTCRISRGHVRAAEAWLSATLSVRRRLTDVQDLPDGEPAFQPGDIWCVVAIHQAVRLLPQISRKGADCIAARGAAGTISPAGSENAASPAFPFQRAECDLRTHP